MSVLFLTQDLMFFSRVAAVAQRAGLQLQPARSPDDVAELLQTADLQLVILDLSTGGVEPEKLLAQVRELSSDPPPVLAYAPHVHAARLEAARAAGCAEVLTRGQFDRQMAALLDKYTGG